MTLHGKNILGHRLSAAGSETFRAIDPALSGPIEPPFFVATAEEVDEAVGLADRAFRDGPAPEPAQTASLLERIADQIEAVGDELIDRCGAETGLPPGRLKMERARTAGQLRLFAALVAEGSWVDARIDRAIPDRQPLPKPDLRRMLVPIGPVLVFPASNFPLAFSVAGGDTASALAAGCPLIVKARPAHPGTSELIGMAVQKAMVAAGMPDGWFSMLHGPGRSTGVRLVEHPAVKAVGFTGSLSGGRKLMDVAAARPEPIPVYAEMGSINPVFLLPGALAERAEAIAAGLCQSMNLGVGQFCTQPGLVIALEDANLARLIDALAKLVEETAPGTMLLKPILDGYCEGTERLSRTPGVTPAARSRQSPDPGKTQAAAAVFVTDAETFLASDDLCAEVFGPATLLVRCRSPEQLLAIAEELEGQLTATIHATEADLKTHGRLVATVRRKAGRLVFGGFPTGVEVCPSMHHGGPYPASSDAHFTSVGTAAVYRFARPVCYQGFPQHCLPPELQDKNVRNVWRLVDGVLTKDDVP